MIVTDAEQNVNVIEDSGGQWYNISSPVDACCCTGKQVDEGNAGIVFSLPEKLYQHTLVPAISPTLRIDTLPLFRRKARDSHAIIGSIASSMQGAIDGFQLVALFLSFSLSSTGWSFARGANFKEGLKRGKGREMISQTQMVIT